MDSWTILQVKVQIGDTSCVAYLEKSPGEVKWSGDKELADTVKEKLSRSYGAAGHPLDLGNAFALDVASAIGYEYGEEYGELLKGKDLLARESKELDEIEASGAS